MLLFNQRWGQQSVDAEFSLTQTTFISDLSIWMNTFDETGHDFTLAIYGDNGAIPDISNELYVSSVIVTDNGGSDAYDNQWQGLSGLNLLLGPGDYWLSFEVRNGQTYSGYMPNWPVAAPNPLANYAFSYSANNYQWINSAENFGVRINGNSVSVSEPLAIVLFLFGMVIVMTRGKRRPAQHFQYL